MLLLIPGCLAKTRTQATPGLVEEGAYLVGIYWEVLALGALGALGQAMGAVHLGLVLGLEICGVTPVLGETVGEGVRIAGTGTTPVEDLAKDLPLVAGVAGEGLVQTGTGDGQQQVHGGLIKVAGALLLPNLLRPHDHCIQWTHNSNLVQGQGLIALATLGAVEQTQNSHLLTGLKTFQHKHGMIFFNVLASESVIPSLMRIQARPLILVQLVVKLLERSNRPIVTLW